MSAILDLMARHRAGETVGLYSVCSANALVIEASLRHTQRCGAAFALIEATSNQVNQFGGYTGMTPGAFRDFVHALADKVGLDRSRVVLGGDHLGPNAWQAEPAEEAMAKAEVMIHDYVAAGFRKIHLDCSMACKGDPTALDDETIAARAARLCAVAEAAYAQAGGEPPVYVIGTEVPTPGGAHETLDGLAVTRAQDAAHTLKVHRGTFEHAGLGEAWERVIALVVQPGVEFDHAKALIYDPSAAKELKALGDTLAGVVFEAHSTDYQPATALAALVRDHFAILKVGPGVTFALREALWGLDAVEKEWIVSDRAARVRDTTLEAMHTDPRYWKAYYTGQAQALKLELEYSLSDRIRYYWPVTEVQSAIESLMDNLEASAPPPALYSQYLPLAFRRLYERGAALTPRALVFEHIGATLDNYQSACSPKESEVS